MSHGDALRFRATHRERLEVEGGIGRLFGAERKALGDDASRGHMLAAAIDGFDGAQRRPREGEDREGARLRIAARDEQVGVAQQAGICSLRSPWSLQNQGSAL